MNAATGYINPSTSGVKIDDDIIIPTKQGNFTYCFEVTKGGLIGLDNNTVIPGPEINKEKLRPALSDGAPLRAKYPDFYSLKDCQ